MAITMGMLMDEANGKNDKEAMQAIAYAYDHWFHKFERKLTEQTTQNWKNTPVLEILKEEIKQ